MDEILLPAKEPFAFASSLRSIRLNPAASGSTANLGNALLHAANLNGQAVGLIVRPSDDESALVCELHSNVPLGPALRSHATAYIENYLSLSDDLAPFYAVAAKDKRFAAAVLARLHGYHPVKFPTPLESSIWAILSQATPATLARKLLVNIAQTYGRPIRIGKMTLTTFPDAQTIIDIPKGELRDLIGSERKALSIQAAARAFATVDASWLCDAPCAYIEAWLREIPGVGAWSSTLILIRGLGRMECVTLDNLASLDPILTACQRVYGYRFDAIRLARMLERYGPYAGYWLHYLRAGVAR